MFSNWLKWDLQINRLSVPYSRKIWQSSFQPSNLKITKISSFLLCFHNNDNTMQTVLIREVRGNWGERNSGACAGHCYTGQACRHMVGPCTTSNCHILAAVEKVQLWLSRQLALRKPTPSANSQGVWGWAIAHVTKDLEWTLVNYCNGAVLDFMQVWCRHGSLWKGWTYPNRGSLECMYSTL